MVGMAATPNPRDALLGAQGDVETHLIHLRIPGQTDRPWVTAPNLSAAIRRVNEQQPLWLIGLIIVVISALCSATGLLMLKRSTIVLPPRPCHRSWWFWGGLVLTPFASGTLETLARILTPRPLLSPFVGVPIIVSFCQVMAGCFAVREKPNATSALGICILFVGVTVAAVFGPSSHEEVHLSPSQLELVFSTLPALPLVSLSGLPVFACCLALVRYFAPRSITVLRSPACALLLALAAAQFGALQLLQFRAFAHAALMGFRTSAYPSHAAMVVQLCSLASCAIAQFGFLTFAIANSPIIFAVPIYYATLSLSSLLLAGVAFDSFDEMPSVDFVLFIFGVGLVVGGTVCNAVAICSSARRSDIDTPLALGAVGPYRSWEEKLGRTGRVGTPKLGG